MYQDLLVVQLEDVVDLARISLRVANDRDFVGGGLCEQLFHGHLGPCNLNDLLEDLGVILPL